MSPNLRDAVTAARENDDYGPLVAAVPYAGYLGLDVVRRPDGLRTRLPVRDDLIGNPKLRALHGGVVGAFVELSALIAALDELAPVHMPKTVSFTVDYLRPARDGQPLEGGGRVLRAGRRIAVVHAEAWQEGPELPAAAGKLVLLLGT